MGLNYEVGDIVTLKKAHPCGSKEWEILRVGADSSEMHGLWTPDHGSAQACGEKYTRFEKIRKKLNLCFTSRERYARINNRDIFHILAL